MNLKPATRQGVKPLVGLFSESGCGKTYSSLLLARGFVGPTGKIAMIDTESGRGSLYADVIPGGYDVLEIREPFSPGRYIEAIQTIEAAKPGIGIIDSGSHEWEGLEGVLDQAAKIEEKSGKPGLHCWRLPKMEHARFVLKLLQSPLPWIVCLRAKHKSRQTKDERNKTVIIKDDFTTPIQADDFIFEMTVHGEIMADHSFRLTKCSHPALKECFPDKQSISQVHGEALARWCAAPGAKPLAQPTTQAPTAPPDEIKALTSKLWTLCKPFRGTAPSWDAAVNQLRAWKILSPEQRVSNLTVEQLREVIDKTEVALQEMEPATT